MANADIWMPIYIGDYLRDTQDLDGPEHGAYLMLLIHYWQKKGEIGSDIKRLSRAAKSDEEITQYILDEYFELVDGKYINARADIEIKNADSRRESASKNGKKGGRPRKEKNPEKTHGLSNKNPEKTHRFPEGKPTKNRAGNPQKSSSPSPRDILQQQAIRSPRDSLGKPSSDAAAAVLKSAGITVTKNELHEIALNLTAHDLGAEFILWAVEEAKSRDSIRNAQGFIKRVLQDPAKYPDWLESYRSRPEPVPDRPKYSGECPECHGKNFREMAGDNGIPECWCQDCKTLVAIWDEDFEMWSPETKSLKNPNPRVSPEKKITI